MCVPAGLLLYAGAVLESHRLAVESPVDTKFPMWPKMVPRWSPLGPNLFPGAFPAIPFFGLLFFAFLCYSGVEYFISNVKQQIPDIKISHNKHNLSNTTFPTSNINHHTSKNKDDNIKHRPSNIEHPTTVTKHQTLHNRRQIPDIKQQTSNRR